MVKHIVRSHFLGSRRQEVLIRQATVSLRQPHASETQISKPNSAETNPVIFHTPENKYFYWSRSLIQTCKLIFR